MTLEFLRAITGTLQWEGCSYTNIPEDKGGPTRFGITQKFLRETVKDGSPVESLTLRGALSIYFDFVWQPNGLWRLTGRGPSTMACKVFDQVVLFGPKTIQWFQKALNMASDAEHSEKAILKVDGVLGPYTARRADEIVQPRLVVDGLCHLQAKYHREVVKRDPSQEKFMEGWMRRAAYDPTPLWIN